MAAGRPGVRRSDQWAWVLGLSPLAYLTEFLLVTVWDLSEDADMFGLMVLLFATLPVAAMDSQGLRGVGVRVSPWWVIVFVPLYLLLRAIRIRTGWHLLVVWTVAMTAFLLAGLALQMTE